MHTPHSLSGRWEYRPSPWPPRRAVPPVGEAAPAASCRRTGTRPSAAASGASASEKKTREEAKLVENVTHEPNQAPFWSNLLSSSWWPNYSTTQQWCLSIVFRHTSYEHHLRRLSFKPPLSPSLSTYLPIFRGHAPASSSSKRRRITYTTGLSLPPPPTPSSTSAARPLGRQTGRQADRQTGRRTYQGSLLDGRGLLLSVEGVLLVGRDLLPLPLPGVDEQGHRPSPAVRAVGLVAVVHALVHWWMVSYRVVGGFMGGFLGGFVGGFLREIRISLFHV